MEVVAGWRPGLLGAILEAHGRYYGPVWGFDTAFEAQQARELAAFAARAVADDLVLSAWEDARFLGSALVEAEAAWDRLRWVIVTERARGLGRRLVTQALAHIDARSRPAYLTTFQGLEAARRLYEGRGFRLVSEVQSMTYGRPVLAQRFERPAVRAGLR